MTFYVAGLLISKDKTKVALIQKNRPSWQAGKLNGIGGHVESDEDPLVAMHREFEEETGVKRNSIGWRYFSTLLGKNYHVDWYKAFGDWDIKTTTDETVSWVAIDDVLNCRVNIIPNIRWLLLLALDADSVTAMVYDPTN